MNRLLLSAAGALVLAGASAANATTFTYGGYNVENNQNMTITGPSVNEISGSGIIDLTGSGPNAGQTLRTICIDIFNTLFSSGVFNLVDPATLVIPALTSAQIGEVGALMDYGFAHVGDSFDVSSALQKAVWDTIYDPLGYTFTGSASVNALALSMEAMSLTPDPDWTALDVTPGNQELGTPGLSDRTPPPVPEPGSAATLLALIGAGLVAVHFGRRRALPIGDAI